MAKVTFGHFRRTRVDVGELELRIGRDLESYYKLSPPARRAWFFRNLVSRARYLGVLDPLPEKDVNG